jgi:hypothetical protein
MIVDDRGDGLVLIEQEAHARLTGDLAAHLSFLVPHHAAFVAAARVHDNGWREADLDATVDDAGAPHTFTTVPEGIYEEVWRRGIERAVAVDELLGLFVGLHGSRFFGSRGSEGMQALLEAERRRQDEALDRLGLGGSWDRLPASVETASDWIAMLDALSLLLCGAPLPDEISPKVAGEGHRLTRSGRQVLVDPWPYGDERLTFAVPARRVSPGPYVSHEALRAALADASTFELSVTVAPGS